MRVRQSTKGQIEINETILVLFIISIILILIIFVLLEKIELFFEIRLRQLKKKKKQNLFTSITQRV